MAIKTRIVNEDTKSTITEKIVCFKCHHDCHCNGDLHSDEYGICTCEDCGCPYNEMYKTASDTTQRSKEWVDGYNKWKKMNGKA